MAPGRSTRTSKGQVEVSGFATESEHLKRGRSISTIEPDRLPKRTKAVIPSSLSESQAESDSNPENDPESKPKAYDGEDDPETDVVAEVRVGEKGCRGVHIHLPPLHQLDDIFANIVKRALDVKKFRGILSMMSSQVLRIATMCSGTEAPILAIQMMNKELARQRSEIKYRHIFSVEIEPFKQAYISKNFHETTIFRDVREVAGEQIASTAYGADQAVPPPGSVDLLVAGFSCVDFSALNNKRKELDGRLRTKDTDKVTQNLEVLDNVMRGSSGDTFHSVLLYAGKHRPPLVILENVTSAKWETIQEDWQGVEYTADYIKVDTKDYYLPPTRQRTYILCIDIRLDAEKAKKAVARWKGLMYKFRRPASSPVEAFLLDEASPYLRRAISEVIKNSLVERTTEGNWSKCQIRHACFRADLKLGRRKPITNWYPGGTSTMQEFGYHEWTRNQVDRIKDSIDLTWLKAATLNYDPGYKARYPDLSQNIDRHANAPWGVTGCLCPSGIPYSTTRGGPITGAESLSLQGIDVQRLLLTTENQKQLQNLAGNAMTSTVVGVAILCALLVGHELYPQSRESDIEVPAVPELDENDNYLKAHQERVFFGPLCASSSIELQTPATTSARYCLCEGANRISQAPIRTCRKCLNTVCDNYMGTPIHDYAKDEEAGLNRSNPYAFINKAMKVLPMLLKLSNPDIGTLRATLNRSGKLSAEVDESLGGVEISITDDVYRFTTAKRSQVWTIQYDGLGSKLELNLANDIPRWYLYAKVWSHLKVSVNIGSNTAGLDVDGTYEWLPNCDMSSSSLYRRVQDKDEELKYLFLDPRPLSPPEDDQYVFAPYHHRKQCGEIRHIDATVGMEAFTMKQWRPSDRREQRALLSIPGEWRKWTAILEEVQFPETEANYRFMRQMVELGNLEPPKCATSTLVFLSCTIPKVIDASSDWIEDKWCILDQIKDAPLLQSFAWFMERVLT